MCFKLMIYYDLSCINSKDYYKAERLSFLGGERIMNNFNNE